MCSAYSTWLVIGAQYLCQCVCGKLIFGLFKLIHSATSAIFISGPGSSYSNLYQEGRLSLSLSNLKHSFAIWYTVFLQCGHRCFPCFPHLVGFSGGDSPAVIDAFIVVVIFLSAVSVCFRSAASLAQSAVIVWSLAGVEMFVAYSLASNIDSSSPLM